LTSFFSNAHPIKLSTFNQAEPVPGVELMQIEVVDDHSTKDDPEAVVRELAGDRVSFYRQSENVGYIKNFETCLQRSRGKLIHLLHSDDCVKDEFYCKLQQAFRKIYYPSYD
jgi:glycosyltransferase involved in cell wall biosynthesis